MNTPNNARSILSKSKIKQALVGLLENNKLSDITIGSICEKAGINRTTFYSHFSDMSDLFKAFESELSEQLEKLFIHALEEADYRAVGECAEYRSDSDADELAE